MEHKCGVEGLKRVLKLGRNLASDRAAHGAALALGFKAAGSGLAIVMFGVAARLMGADKFGQFAILFNIASFLAVAACLGQETLIFCDLDRLTGDPCAGRGAIL